MLIGILLILLTVCVALTEKYIKNWGIRVALVLVGLIVITIVSTNVGMTIGSSMEKNRFSRNLIYIFSSLREYDEGIRSEVLDELKQRISAGNDSSEIESLLNYLELRLQSEREKSSSDDLEKQHP